MTKLVLGSASPRRAELLGRLGAQFAVRPSDIAESPRAAESAADFCARAAGEKALAVAADCTGAWVLGADTVVALDGEILGKPLDGEHARRMLRRLSGRTHRVLTAVALVAPDGSLCEQLLAETAVEFHPLSADDIDAYVRSGDPLDKAGAYGIQAGGGRFVRRMIGSYENVMGLPLEEVRTILRRHGLA